MHSHIAKNGIHLHPGWITDNLPGRGFSSNRKEKFPILKHLSPDSAVDAAAKMLDELAVDVFRNRMISF